MVDTIMERKYTIKVEGMSCASCKKHVEDACLKVDNVIDASADFITGDVYIKADGDISLKEISKNIKNAGYKAILEKNNTEDKRHLSQKISLIVSIVLLVPLFYISMGYMTMDSWKWPLGLLKEYPFLTVYIELVLSLLIVALNYKLFLSGIKSLIHLKPNMDALVSLSCVVSFVYSIYNLISMHIFYNEPSEVMRFSMNVTFESVGMVPTFVSIGKFIQEYTKNKSRKELGNLASLLPKKATVVRDGKQFEIDTDKLIVGDIFLVKPNSLFPCDGVVMDGYSSVDESSLTGEALPIDKKSGDKVFTSCMNLQGVLTCKAIKTGDDTILNSIIKLVKEASISKSKATLLADKISAIFVPVVLSISIITFICWFVFGNKYVSDHIGISTLSFAIERACSVLVISCPCALGLATPVSVMVSSLKGTKEGILIKDARALELVSSSKYIVFDKTGTLTKGNIVLDEITVDKRYYSLIYELESNFNHPISKAICSYLKEYRDDSIKLEDIVERPGLGVECTYKEKNIKIGNCKMFNDIEDKKEKKSISYIYIDGDIVGYISFKDEIKEDAYDTIALLKKQGLIPVLLSGDSKESTDNVARELNIDIVYSSLLPIDKLSAIKTLKESGKVIMVGDGTNDSASLKEADVGIAFNSGTDIAISSSDIVLMHKDLFSVYKSIKLARAAERNIKENLFWAFIYNSIMIPIAAGVLFFVNLSSVKPWMSAIAMSLSSICVVLNALRLNLVRLDTRKGKGMLLKKRVKIQLQVEGMMCSHCAKSVEESIKSIKGVKKVEADNKTGIVLLESKDVITEDDIRVKIESVGKKLISYTLL